MPRINNGLPQNTQNEITTEPVNVFGRVAIPIEPINVVGRTIADGNIRAGEVADFNWNNRVVAPPYPIPNWDEEMRTPIHIPESYEEVGKRIGSVVDKKNADYGDAINDVNDLLAILYPDGISEKQYKDAAVIIRVLDKVKRIAHGNHGYESAWNDIAGYGILMSRRD